MQRQAAQIELDHGAYVECPRRAVGMAPMRLWPKAIHHRSLGQRPRDHGSPAGILAEGHSHPTRGAESCEREYGLRPNRLASLVAFLASDAAGYITGQIVSINGGMA